MSDKLINLTAQNNKLIVEPVTDGDEELTLLQQVYYGIFTSVSISISMVIVAAPLETPPLVTTPVLLFTVATAGIV